MSYKSENASGTGESYTILTDENKITHGIELMHEINAGIDARRCRKIANGTEPYPVNRQDPVNHPRDEPDEPAQPVLLAGVNGPERELNKIAVEEYRAELSNW